MANNNVKSNVVNIGLQPDLIISLDKYVRDNLTIPISVFKASSINSAIEFALAYLNQKQEGVVEIPATDTQSWVKIVASRNSLGEVHINFITTMHRYPTVETRPYTGDPWEAGDIVLSNDILATKCIGWACLYPGTPGAWEQFGHTKRWYSQLEPVSSLPDPSELQANRLVIHQLKDEMPYNIYYCTKLNENSDWRWVNLRIFDAELPGCIHEYLQNNPLIKEEVDQYFKDNPVRTTVDEYFKDNPVRGTVDKYFEDNPIKADEIVHQYLVDNPIDADEAVNAYFEQNPINVQNEIETYLGSNPITTTIDMTLNAVSWSGSAAPYQQLLTNDAFASASDGIANLSSLCSDAQYTAAANARMIISAQNGNSITISAYGTKPTVDIPITIILINSRNNS